MLHVFRLIFQIVMIVFVVGAVSSANATNSISYHGRIIQPNGSAFEPSSATLVLQIRSTGTEDCLMWEETYSNVDMTGTAGVFSLNLNSGAGSRTDGSGLTFAQVFGNYPTTTMTVPLANCAGGSNTITLTANSHRIARLRFKDSVMPSFEQTPDMAIAYVPFSMDSQKVGGFTPQNLLRVEDATGPQAAAAFSPADFLELQALIGGSSGQYEKAGELNGQAIPALSNNNVLAWNGGGWTAVTPITSETDPNTRAFAKADLPTCDPDEFLQSTGANTWVCAGVSGAAGGTVTSITVGSGLVDGSNNTGTSILTTGTIALPDLVTAGTGTKVTYDVKGRITASTTLAETDLPNITTAGKVSGDAITSGTIAGSTAMNTSGNITAATGSLRTLVLRDADTNTVTVQTPADVTANYVLTLPPNDGGAGEVLTTDGSGNLTWAAGGGAATSLVSATTGGPTIPSADGTAAAPVYSFTGDEDTGMFRAAANNLAFATNGAEKMRILADGKVGIGTTNPEFALHVKEPTAGTGVFNPTLLLEGGSVGSGGGPFIQFRNAAATDLGQIVATDTGSYGSAMVFKTKDADFNGTTSSIERMRIHTSGNVSIGTTAALSPLYVSKGTTGATAAFEGAGSYGSVRIGNVNNLGVAGGRYLELTGGDEATTNYDQAAIRSVGYGADLIIQSASGRIDLKSPFSQSTNNTASYINKLEVGHGAYGQGSAYAYGLIAFAADINQDTLVIDTGTATHNRDLLQVKEGGNTRFVVNGSGTGQVGIGTATAAAKLHVHGNAKIGTDGGVISSMGTCTFTQAITTTDTLATCTGVPASTTVVVSCSPQAALSAAVAVVTRGSGTIDQIYVLGTNAATSVTWSCFWVKP